MKPAIFTLFLGFLCLIGTFVSIRLNLPCIAFFCPFLGLLLALIGLELYRENK
jgi:hypothetical protein